MANSTHIKSEESAAVIEVSGAVNLARLLQTLGNDTRARIVGVAETNALGATTIVIAGGLAEVQHASTLIKELQGVGDVAFFAKPDLQSLNLLLKSLKISETASETQTIGKTEHKTKQRVRSAEELDITQINDWNVHELRRYARSVEHFPLKGRLISKANRPQLIALLESIGVLLPRNSATIYGSQQMLPS